MPNSWLPPAPEVFRMELATVPPTVLFVQVHAGVPVPFPRRPKISTYPLAEQEPVMPPMVFPVEVHAEDPRL